MGSRAASPFVLGLVVALAAPEQARAQAEVHDAHFHLTNYVQRGITMPELLRLMGKTVGRAAVFGIPLQQTWDYANTGDFAPTYYLETDAPLYYYSFTDAMVATAYRALTREQQARLDPMITGFNPADMYAVDHIKRVLLTYPGVFSGIGEFAVHKEFVSAKIAGETPSLLNPALDRIFEFAGEAGLVVLLHNDVDVPFPRESTESYQTAQLSELFARHPDTTIIWAIVATPETTRATAALINRYPTRFLFGTDEVAPADQRQYLSVYRAYEPLFAALTPEARALVKKGNYERLFDEARRKVRRWEQAELRQLKRGVGR
jgi:hypothetical protein